MKTRVCWLLSICLLLVSCREDIMILPTGTEQVSGAVSDTLGPAGIYLLCEGNMGSNKASLDFMNLRTGEYTTNIYGARNPNVIKDLGDVGNDIGIYGNRLWAVINCSHKVEVMDKNTCLRIGQVNIPNCRHITFAHGKAYVASYVAPVSLDPNAERGAIFEIDTATLQVTNKVVVGYQPEELTIQGHLLYVANSGGYRAPNYDSTLSVIDLSIMQEIRRIPVAINLFHVQQDSEGRLWVTSRGHQNGSIAPRLFVLENEQIVKTFDVDISGMHICGDSLYFYSSKSKDTRYGIINTRTMQLVNKAFITDGTDAEIALPYGLIVNPHNHDIYLTDAENYVSSGMLYCFSRAGKCKWKHRTGDIPAHMCFLDEVVTGLGNNGEGPTQDMGRYLHEVLEYVPAPGQFINLMPKYEEGNTATDMVDKCTQALAKNARGMVSLGGFGGYLTFRFDHAVQNIPDEYDFQVLGNSFAGTSEPGVVWVSVDENKNGKPDDAWYELAGSEYHAAETVHHYTIHYVHQGETIQWQDSQDQQGIIERNPFHEQDYFPQWLDLKTPLAFTGTLLASRTYIQNGTYGQTPRAWGYVDNLPNNNAEGNSFKIEWAVDAAGEAVQLSSVDFIRIQTAVHESYPQIGELSTEITGAIDLHYTKTGGKNAHR